MAVIKHIAIKNSNYNAAYDYLTTLHDEFSGKAILDENNKRIPRDFYLIEGINCDPETFKQECDSTNFRFGKNQTKEEIKAHHYIISFDPKDRDDNGLTPQRAQKLGAEFAKKYFPGHQIIVCTHPDGHGNAGNIHTHIVLNSVRAMDVARQDFMDRPCDALAGNKHHVTKNFLEFLKQQTMEMCQQESLNQVNLLSPAKVRITDKEYWAQRRRQKLLDEESSVTGIPKAKYKTLNMLLREQISATLKDSHSFDEFTQKLFANYGITIQESRGQISYHLPDRTKPIRGKTLGTDFERSSILHFFAIGYRIVPDTEIRTVTDLSNNTKAQSSKAYTNKIKAENLRQESKAVAFLQEHGITPEELENRFQLAFDDYSSLNQKRKNLEQEMAITKNAIYALKQYYETKSVHTQYLKSKNKKAFREEHNSKLSIYDSAVKELRMLYGEEKFPSRKSVQANLSSLKSKYDNTYEDFCTARNHYREMRTLKTNYQALQGEQIPDNNMIHHQKTV